MLKAEIIVGEEYGLVLDRRGAKKKLQRVRVVRHLGGKKWRVEHVENSRRGALDVEAKHIVVHWKNSAAFIAEQEARTRFDEENERNGCDHESPEAHAITDVFDAIGDGVSYYRGDLSGPAKALERVIARANRDPTQRAPAQFVDRFGNVHVPYAEALDLAKALCVAEPEIVVSYIQSAVDHWAKRAEEGGVDVSDLLNMSRAESALIRDWARQGRSLPSQRKIQRLRQLVLKAIDVLENAALEEDANLLRQELAAHLQDE